MITNWKTYRPRLSPAMVIALLALVVALSAPAHAAMERLAKGTVGTAQLKNGAVTTPKLRNGAVTTPKIRTGAVTNPKIGNGAVTNGKIGSGAVTSSKIRDGSIALGDLSPDAYPKPPRSVSAKSVDWTPLNWEGVETARLDLAAGRWIVIAKATVSLTRSAADCYLNSGDTEIDSARSFTDSGLMRETVAMMSPVRLSGSRAVSVKCYGNAGASVVGNVVLSAIQVR